MLSLRLAGWLALRYAERAFCALLMKLPPRNTRWRPLRCDPSPPELRIVKHRAAQLEGAAVGQVDRDGPDRVGELFLGDVALFVPARARA